ncbi:MAG: SAM-dependent methyltransferase [Streptosporangiaceae bacterium]
MTPLGDDFPDIDTTIASAARMYDYALGGTDNYPVDRQAVDAGEDRAPGGMAELRSNRRFLERVVRHLVGECGIRQFIDNGSGLPTQQNVHQVAQRLDPAVRVVYIDNDPVVLGHQKVSALLAADKSSAFLMEDARDVDRILSHPDTRRLIDFDEPVAVLYLSFMHFIPDADDPWGMARRLMDRVAPGSYLAISHFVADDPETRQELTDVFFQGTGGHFGRLRERAEVDAFFAGLEIVEPGLVRVAGWRSDIPAELQNLKAFEYGGVGRKPA